jgi:flagellar assembly factor FliW
MPAPVVEPADAPDRTLRFPDGIPGFGQLRNFDLLSLGEDTVFQLLQSTDDPDVAMVVVVPWLFFPDYEIDIPDDERQRLAIERPEDAVVFSPVTLAAEDRKVYVNLVGPFVVNPRTGEGRQVVLTDSDHPLRAPVSLD